MKRFLLAAIFAVTSLTGILPAHADLKESDAQYVVPRNYVQNPGFENALSKWTSSGGTFTRASSGSNLVTGTSSGVWDSSAAAQTLSNSAFTIPVALKSKMGIAQCNILTPSGTATHLLQVYDGSIAVASQTVQSSTTAKLTRVPFKFPSSGTLRLRLLSVNANEPAIAIDDCFVGEWTSAVSMTTTERDAVTTPLAGIVIYNSTLAQVQYYNGSAWVSVGANLGSATSLNSSAAFQVDSTTAGVLIPRMTLTQRDAIGSPATGLQIYNTDTNEVNVYNGTSWLSVGSGSGGSGGVNILDKKNFNFENGTGDWTASGGSFTNETSAPLDALKSGKFNSSATSQTLSSALVAMPEGFVGRKCQVHIPYYKYASGTDGDYTIKVLDGSSNVLSGPDNLLVTGSTATFPYFNTFDCPASGSSMKVVITSTADAGDLIIDDVFLGQGRNVVGASQASFVGSAYFAGTAACGGWTRTNVALGSFASDTDCPGPTVEFNPGPGTIQATDSDLPKVTVNNMPVGEYDVYFTAQIANSAGSGTEHAFAINDGTTTSATYTNSSNDGSATITVVGHFSYTTSANHTFELYGSASSGSVTIANDNTGLRRTSFRIYRYPKSTIEGYTYDTMALAWSGYHDSTCSFARTNVAFGDFAADSTCVFGERRNVNFGTVTSRLSGSDKLPGIVFTPKRIGTYYICADLNAGNAAGANSVMGVQMLDSANNVIASRGFKMDASSVGISLCGFYYAASVSSETIRIEGKSGTSDITIALGTGGDAIGWTIFATDQAFPAPVFNTISKKVDSNVTGTKIGSALIASGCLTATVNNESMVVSGVSNSTGDCTMTLTTGYFSAPPVCTCSPYVANSGRTCTFNKTTPLAATTVRFNVTAAASAAAEADEVLLICIGK
jgi:hypothetical protein